MEKIYYVYKHIDDDGSVVYVGKGKNDRAWQSTKKRRCQEHIAWMNSKLPFLNVQIHAHSLEEKEAFRIERELIKELNPRFNHPGKVKQFAQGKWLAATKSRFHESELQTELGRRAAASPNHPNKKIMTCIHCGAQMNTGHITRYHNDNCKKRVELNELN